jgi:uncharacterized protein YndB with AHSA1/START domain
MMAAEAQSTAAEATGILHVELEFPIAAPVERVWAALLDEVAAWWPRDFRVLGGDSEMHLEPRVGGRLYEETPGGASLLWATVIALDPLRQLDLAGHLTPRFGGPATTLTRLGLRDVDGGTVFEVGDAVFGHIGEGMRTSLETGWRQLFEGGLKAYVEAGGR